MKIMYKIVDWKDGAPHTLFHGVNGSRKMPADEWIVADKKMVTDGSRQNPYLSGFHVMPTLESCIVYLKKFKNVVDKAVVCCEVKKIRPKPQASGPVFLADKIKITGRKVKYSVNKCNRYSEYKGVRAPRCGCKACWDLYLDR
jgi:hypothetical protein